MSNENKQDETIENEKNEKTSQATVLKQLNDQTLYPMQERIGIYVIAALSTLGLILITYTGVMAVVTSGTNGYTPTEVDIDNVNELLDDLDDLLESIVEEEPQEGAQHEADLHEYVDSEETQDADEEPEMEPATEPETEPETTSPSPTHGTINANLVEFFRHPNVDGLGFIYRGDVVSIIDFDSNPYWIAVDIPNEFGISPVYIERSRVDID
ncbi:MAG: hypothetical protein FWG67_08680 [Defluviitaleaceae bacterium]|nr:hypothetical protein [Defluviitaleaceae bacterium]